MIELTDLQEDILTLAIKKPDMTNKEVADVLDCSAEYVGEVRRKYEHKVDESQVDSTLNTIRRDARDVSVGNGGLLDLLFLKPLILSLTFSLWALERSLELSIWLLDVGLALSIWLLENTLTLSLWLIELPFRILGAFAGSKD